MPQRRVWQAPQCSRLENLRDRGAWRATVHGAAKSQIRLSMHTHMWGREKESEVSLLEEMNQRV